MSVPNILPPSPPTTNHRNRNSIPLAFKPSMSTPDDSPASFPPSSGAGTRKRVDFSPWPNVVDPLSSTPSSKMTAMKILPPSRDCPTSKKSILKPFTETAISMTSTDGSGDQHNLLPETLEAIAQQLGNNNKGSSLDAYQTLSQIIKAYDEIPEDVNTRSCIAGILRCIKRDLSTQDQTQSSPIDTNLMTQALKVSVILVWSEHFSPLLTDEFRVFIIDRSINALTEHTAPKVIIIHYMHLLAMQNFRPGILSTNNRAGKLLEALQDITNHVQGKGAVAERLLIYQKLIEQAKPIMKSRVSLWIKEIFLGLSSSVKDIRDKAISVSTRACAAYPCSPTVSAAAREALATTIADRAGNSRTLSSILTQRLEKMVAAKDEAVQVPQIWALGMLLCSSIDTRLESWNILREWLKVIQRCFNCSDTSVRSQAFPAWNRFIYISRPHEASETILSMLSKPIIAQIERTSINTTGKGLRPAAVSSYHMLLYYAFRPAASHKQYTKMWNEYIVKTMGNQFLSKSTANADMCSRIVTSLMWREHSASRIWNENRAHENTLLEPEELPTIDCKWIRSNTEAILHIYRLLFAHSVWGPSVQHSDQAFVAKAWRHFLRAIRESASKEIKLSTETKKALSHVTQFMQEVSDPSSGPASSHGRSQLVCSIAVAELGPACFLEALENDLGTRCPSLLHELSKIAMTSAIGTQSNLSNKKGQPSATSLSNNLQRCLKLLNESLQRAYNADSHDLKSTLGITSKLLKTSQSGILSSSLKIIQPGLSTVMEDKRNLAKLGSDSSSLLAPWVDLSETVANVVAAIPSSEYYQLDDLLAATLMSCNIFTRNLLLKAWVGTSWQEDKASYGVKLLEAINQTRDHTEINLPGMYTPTQEPVTQIERHLHTDSAVVDVHDPIIKSLENAQETAIDTFVVEDIVTRPNVGAEVLPKERPSSSARSEDALTRVHHNDSQVDFVRIEGPVAYHDEIESQFLTNRQKEVRARQQAEQAVTFPDLRSSPRPRSAHGSRATSVDCEMARKMAAADHLPSTPTLNRQNDMMEEDEIPSPTPKARNKSLGIIDVEIPSSPPSAIGNRSINIPGLDVLSSPPKAQNDPEIDIVLDDVGLEEHDVSTKNDKLMNEANVHIATVITCADAQADEDPSVVAAGIETSITPSDLRSTVSETLTVLHTKDLGTGGHHREISLAADNDSICGVDDIDELSASQLSQSLDSYIADEVQNSFVQTEPLRAGTGTQRRRKRMTTGYADQDRKKRRRRTTSQNRASVSEAASDESFNTAETTKPQDRMVASRSQSRTRHKDGTSKDVVMDRAEYTSPATLTENSYRAGQPGVHSIPLHMKTQDSDVKAGPGSTSEMIASGPSVTPAKLVAKSAQWSAEDEEVDTVASHTSIMTALQTALDGLKGMRNQGQQASIDLKAIDDLCFKIRFQAQELTRNKD